jgi:hypothetical protein
LDRWQPIFPYASEHHALISWVPDGPEVIHLLMLAIGLAGSQSADNFQVCVATPAGLGSPKGMRIRPKDYEEAGAAENLIRWAAIEAPMPRASH